MVALALQGFTQLAPTPTPARGMRAGRHRNWGQPHQGAREIARRQRQALAGILRAENGLVAPGRPGYAELSRQANESVRRWARY